MPTELHMVKHLSTLHPWTEVDAEVLGHVKQGEVLKISFTRPINARFRAKFFVMLGIIFKNQEHYKSRKELLNICKIRIGHVDAVETPQGLERWPASISWAKMDDTEFSDFYNRAVDWVLSEVIPGLQRQHLDQEVEAELMGFAE